MPQRSLAISTRAHATGPRPTAGAVAAPTSDSDAQNLISRLQTENSLLKVEAGRRESELDLIRQKFASIVAEVKRRDAGADPQPKRSAAERKDTEQFIAELKRRVDVARKEAVDMRKLAEQLQEQKKSWQRKCKHLRTLHVLHVQQQQQPPTIAHGKLPRGTGGVAATALAVGSPLAPGSPQREFATVGVGGTPPPSVYRVSGHHTPRTAGASTPRVSTAAAHRVAEMLAAAAVDEPVDFATTPRMLEAGTSPLHKHLTPSAPASAIICGPAPVRTVTSDAQTARWEDLVAFERSIWDRERAQQLPQQQLPLTAAAPSGVVDVLQRENASLQSRLSTAGDQIAAAEARCQRLQDERDMLINAAGGDPGRGPDGGVEEKQLEQLHLLQQELAAKNAQLVLLDGRFKQATSSVNDLKRANEQILDEMRRLNDTVAHSNQRALEAENAMQVAQVGLGRIESLEAMLRDKDAEVRELMATNRELLSTVHRTRTETEASLRSDWEQRLEQKERALDESERNNRRLFRDAQTQEQHLEQQRKDLARTKREREEGRDEVVRLQEEVRDLQQRIKLFGGDSGKITDEDEEDVHKALALIQHHRRRGDPTDLEFLMATWDSGAAELQDVRAENMRLLRELEEGKKLIKVWQERHARDVERLEGLQRADVARKRLTEQQRDQIWQLQTEVAKGGAVRVTRDSDASSVVTLEGENVLELGLGHLKADPRYFAHPDSSQKPPTFFVTADFFDFDTVVSGGASGLSVTFDQSLCFTVAVCPELYHCMRHRAVDLELQQQQGLTFETVGRATVQLKMLLGAGCVRHTGHVQFKTPGGEDVAQLEYHVALKTALPAEWREQAETVSAASDLPALPPHVSEAFRSVSALRVFVREARDLHRASASEPVPYVLVTAAPTGGPLDDQTVELVQPRHTYHPRYDWDHEWPVAIDSAFCKYISDCVLHFVVLDDAGDDPRAPPLGRASVNLAPLLDGPARNVDRALSLLDSRGADVGVIDVALRWVSDHTVPPPLP